MENSDFEKVFFLGRCHTFAGLTPELLSSVAAESTALKLPKGSSVYQQGRPIRAIYAIAYGSLSVRINGTNTRY
jgi:CRP-like cAMP-binding protein